MPVSTCTSDDRAWLLGAAVICVGTTVCLYNDDDELAEVFNAGEAKARNAVEQIESVMAKLKLLWQFGYVFASVLFIKY